MRIAKANVLMSQAVFIKLMFLNYELGTSCFGNGTTLRCRLLMRKYFPEFGCKFWAGMIHLA